MIRSAALLLAAVFGYVLAGKTPPFKPTSRLLTALFAARIARAGCASLRPDVAGRLELYLAGQPVPPYEGLARASWALESALAVAWYALLAFGIRATLRPRSDDEPDNLRGAVVGAAGIVFVAVQLWTAYPVVRGQPIELGIVGIFYLSLAVQSFAVADYLTRWRRPHAGIVVALLLAAGSVADALGQYASGHPVRDAGAAGPAGVLVWCLIGAVELWALAATRRSGRW